MPILTNNKNMDAVKENWPNIFQQIKDPTFNQDEYRVSTAKKIDAPIIEKNIDGSWFSLYSKFNPYEEADHWVQSIEQNPKHIILFGYGLGYHYEALKRKFPQTRFHIIEPEPQLFLLYCSNVNLKPDQFNTVDHFLLSNRLEDYQQFFNNIIHLIGENWLILSPPKFKKEFETSYSLLKVAFKKSKEKVLDIAVSHRKFQKTWNFNALKNLPKIFHTPNIFNYKDQFKGQTVILTASGPSLNDAIPFIKRVQESKRAIVIAAGTSVNALMAKGIKPDLLVSYDPMIANYEALHGIIDKDIPLVFGSTIFPQLIDEYNGPLANMVTSQDMISKYLDSTLKKDQIIQDAPTITAVALDLLNKLNVKEVYIAGQDLCFINEKVGADGVYFYNKEGHLGESHLKDKDYIENNNGEMALTNRSFIKMKEFIEEIVGKMDGSMRIHSLSLYGAKISGMPYCSILEAKEAINQLKPIEIDFSFHPTSNLNNYKEAIEKISEDINFYKEAQQTLQRQINKYYSASSNQKEKWVFKIDNTLDRLTLNTSFQQIMYPLVANRINLMIRMKNNLDLNGNRELEEYYEKGVIPLTQELESGIKEYMEILLVLNNKLGEAK